MTRNSFSRYLYLPRRRATLPCPGRSSDRGGAGKRTPSLRRKIKRICVSHHFGSRPPSCVLILHSTIRLRQVVADPRPRYNQEVPQSVVEVTLPVAVIRSVAYILSLWHFCLQSTTRLGPRIESAGSPRQSGAIGFHRGAQTGVVVKCSEGVKKRTWRTRGRPKTRVGSAGPQPRTYVRICVLGAVVRRKGLSRVR